MQFSNDDGYKICRCRDMSAATEGMHHVRDTQISPKFDIWCGGYVGHDASCPYTCTFDIRHHSTAITASSICDRIALRPLIDKLLREGHEAVNIREI